MYYVFHKWITIHLWNTESSKLTWGAKVPSPCETEDHELNRAIGFMAIYSPTDGISLLTGTKNIFSLSHYGYGPASSSFYHPSQLFRC